VVFETAIPEVLPPLPPPLLPMCLDTEQTIDETVWAGPPDEPRDLPGEIVFEPEERDGWLTPAAVEESNGTNGAAQGDGDFGTGWAAVRDANIRPYIDWVVPAPLSLPIAAVKAVSSGPAPRHEHHNRPSNKQGGGGNKDRRDRKGRRRRRGRPEGGGHDRPREQNRGPRLPGMYNPGGD
jgi:hypothetical protein